MRTAMLPQATETQAQTEARRRQFLEGAQQRARAAEGAAAAAVPPAHQPTVKRPPVRPPLPTIGGVSLVPTQVMRGVWNTIEEQLDNPATWTRFMTQFFPHTAGLCTPYQMVPTTVVVTEVLYDTLAMRFVQDLPKHKALPFEMTDTYRDFERRVKDGRDVTQAFYQFILWCREHEKTDAGDAMQQQDQLMEHYYAHNDNEEDEEHEEYDE